MDCIEAAPEETVEIPQFEEPVVKRSTLRYALTLGMLTALGALGIDMYLPAFPLIAHSLGVSVGKVQLSLVSYFIAMALGQIIYGPISDRYGRRTPLLVGLALFCTASVASALTRDIDLLIVMRFFQGIGACAGMVLSRAIVRDLRSGEEAARLFASMLLVLGVSPICAPLLGSILTELFPWQSIFWLLAGLSVGAIVCVLFLLDESHPVHRRTTGGIGEAAGNYLYLAKDPAFVLPVLSGGLSQAVLFAYLSASPFIYITLHHVPTFLYSVLFATNAIGLIGLAQYNVNLLRKFGPRRLIRFATTVQSVSALILLSLVFFHADSLVLLALCFFVCVGVHGLIGPTTSMLSLEPYPAFAGAASALGGMIQFACGAVSGILVSARFNGTALPAAEVFAGCAILGLIIAFLKPAKSEMVISENVESAAH